MLKPPKVAAYISLPELGQPKPTLRDVVQIAKTINRSAGLTVLGQMNLFLGAASIKQDTLLPGPWRIPRDVPPDTRLSDRDQV